MATLAWHAESDVPVSHALAIGRAAHAATHGATRVFVYAASLRGDARVLGEYQREEDALASSNGAAVHRRLTGGPAVVAGDGTFYLALALADASAIMECPTDRVLNRNVRPLLAALRDLGASAHYFGREFISVDRRPAALVAWTRHPSGSVLLESVLGVERSFALPDDELGVQPETPRMLGKAPIRLADAMPAFTARSLASEVVRACAAKKPFDAVERALDPYPPRLFVPPRVEWSRAREIPIGIVRAGLRLDEARAIEDAVIAGDFFQDAVAPERLRAALIGAAPTPERLRDAVERTYGAPGAIEGVKTLQPILDCFLELG
jgi:hypothetical protein